MEIKRGQEKLIRRVAVIGGGAWGTTMARMLAVHSMEVRLWCYEQAVVDDIQAHRRNDRYLPGIDLPENIIPLTGPAETVDAAELIVFATPSSAAGVTARLFAPVFPATNLLNISKGFEEETAILLSVYLQKMFKPQNLAVLSGPNLAREIAAGLPGTTVVASENEEFALLIQDLLRNSTFRVYVSNDPLGVELGGALKNIYALGVGICDGLGFGDNTKAALLTRCVAEMTRLGETLGACRETFMGLSGVGDLVATSISPQSRNRTVGVALGQGLPLAEAEKRIVGLAEGVTTVRVVMRLARERQLDLPVAEQVEAILSGRTPAAAAVENLMNRMPREEFWT